MEPNASEDGIARTKKDVLGAGGRAFLIFTAGKTIALVRFFRPLLISQQGARAPERPLHIPRELHVRKREISQAPDSDG